jgi:hypothetical protein
MNVNARCNALPWLVACLFASTYAQADPMRPLSPPPASSANAPKPVVAQADGSEPRTQGRDTEAFKPGERLIAIRQDSSSRWQALVGERWLRVGDKLDGYTVAAIDANAVQLSEGRQRKTLHLLPPLWRPGPGESPPAIPPPGLAQSPPGPSTEVAHAGLTALSPQRAQGLSTP